MLSPTLVKHSFEKYYHIWCSQHWEIYNTHSAFNVKLLEDYSQGTATRNLLSSVLFFIDISNCNYIPVFIQCMNLGFFICKNGVVGSVMLIRWWRRLNEMKLKRCLKIIKSYRNTDIMQEISDCPVETENACEGSGRKRENYHLLKRHVPSFFPTMTTSTSAPYGP